MSKIRIPTIQFPNVTPLEMLQAAAILGDHPVAEWLKRHVEHRNLRDLAREKILEARENGMSKRKSTRLGREIMWGKTDAL